jgi:multidrug efflux pump subunit AcrA (membrane-fusion protein)
VPVIKEVQDYEDFPGRIEAKGAVEVRARVTGYLKRFHFVEGADVKEGDLLFEIDPRPYKAELARAQGAVTQSEGRLKRLEADYGRAMDLLRRNAMSREDFDRIIGERTEAAGNLEVAKANLEMARLNLDWTQVRASQSGKISRRFIDPGNMVKADETTLTTIVSLHPIYAYFDLDERSTLKGQRLLREGKVKWTPTSPLTVFLGLADEDRACGTRVWLDPARMAERGLTTAAVLTALRGQDDIRVVAGQVERPARERKAVEVTLITPVRLAEAARLEAIALKTDSDGRVTRLKDVARVERGPNYSGYPRRGEIDFADNRVDPDTGTWRLRATFNNPDLALYPGLYVRVRLPLGTPYKATLVSEQALSTDQGQKFVYVVNKDSKADYRRVQLGRIHDGLRAVVAGLEKDDKVIVRGLQRVRPGMPVRYQVVDMPLLTDPTAEEKAESRKPKAETNPKSK